jgi:hypothetical protein
MFDIWRSGYIRRPLASVIATPPRADEIRWLPLRESRFQYLADPFALEVDGRLSVLVEAFDYRVRRGEIHYLTFDAEDRLVDEGLALSERWHLSYPSLIQEGGELYMLPEAHKSKALTLYRCQRFPDRWRPVKRLLDLPAIDASVVRHDGRWWMFFTLPGHEERAMRELYVAAADQLMGPWRTWPSPVLTGLNRSRPGGEAFVMGGHIHLPVQDCSQTYGGALNLLRIADPNPGSFRASMVDRMEAKGLLSGFTDGLHTLSGVGGVTCIDVKAFAEDPQIEPLFKKQARLRRYLGVNRARSTANAWARPIPAFLSAGA